MKKTKLLIALSSAVLAIGGASAIVSGSTKILPAKAYSASDWSAVLGGGNATDYFTFNTDTIVSTGTAGMNANGIVKEDANAIGDYTVSVSGQGTMDWPNSKDVRVGLLPWYLDDENYILVYMEWSNSERPSSMRVTEFTGRINGSNPVVWKSGAFVASEWNDAWMDGGNATNCIQESSAWTFSVKKARSTAGDTDEFTAYINGNQVGFFGFRDTVLSSARTAKVGLYAYNDTVTFSSFTVTNANNSKVYAPLGSDAVAKSASGAWTNATTDVYAIDETAGVDPFQSALIKDNPYQAGNYEVKATFADSALVSGATLGIVGWYQDEYNYALASIVKSDTDTSLVISGNLTTLNGADKTTTPFSETLTLTAPLLAGNNTLDFKKIGGKLSLVLNDGTEAVTYSNAVFTTGGKVGLVAMKANVSLTLALSAITYQAYDWYKSTINGQDVYLSAASDVSPLTYANGVYSFAATAVTASDNTLYSGAYFASNKWESVGISAKFAVSDATSTYGLYPWIQDGSNYCRVVVTPSKILVEQLFAGVASSSEIALPSSFTYVADHTLASSIEKQQLTLTLDGVEILSKSPLSGNDTSVSPSVGFLAGGAAISLSDVTVTGFSNGDTITDGDWQLRGPRPSTWSFNEDKSELTGSYNGGTSWQQTNATLPCNSKDLYQGATLNILKGTASEYKTGLLPYYLDSDNYVFVWLSKWSDGAPSLVVTIKLNGQVIGTEWRETSIGINYLNTDIKLETQISGDTINVWIDAGSVTTYTGTAAGLSNRQMSGARVGFNISNTTTTFKDFTLESATRVYGFTEKPVINETGTRPTAGVVGTSIKLPVYTATNSRYDTLNPVISVTSPSGQTISLAKNAFTPSEVGNYSVNVSCEDSWGNQADPIAYTIAVSGTTPSSSTPDSSSSTPTSATSQGGTTNNSGNNNVGIVVGSVVGGVVLVGAGVGLFFFLKKRKAK